MGHLAQAGECRWVRMACRGSDTSYELGDEARPGVRWETVFQTKDPRGTMLTHTSSCMVVTGSL